MEPFEGNLSIRGYLKSLRYKSQQKQHGKLSALTPGLVSQCAQLSFDYQKGIFILSASKVAFLKSGYIQNNSQSFDFWMFSGTILDHFLVD